jgi:hypothetical protein
MFFKSPALMITVAALMSLLCIASIEPVYLSHRIISTPQLSNSRNVSNNFFEITLLITTQIDGEDIG